MGGPACVAPPVGQHRDQQFIVVDDALADWLAETVGDVLLAVQRAVKRGVDNPPHPHLYRCRPCFGELHRRRVVAQAVRAGRGQTNLGARGLDPSARGKMGNEARLTLGGPSQRHGSAGWRDRK